MHANEHPAFEVLVDFVEGVLTGEPHATWSEHVRACPGCQETMKQIESTLASLRGSREEDAPDTWIHRAVQRAVPRRMSEPMSGEYAADIAFDSHRQIAAGVRSSAIEGRQLVLASERLEIEVSVAAEAAREEWPLTGQLFVLEGSNTELRDVNVTLLEGDRETDSARTSATGEFLLRTRPSGAFRLRFAGSGWSVTSPPLTP